MRTSGEPSSPMAAPWPIVRLEEVLRHVPRPVSLHLATSYREVGIRSHGRGIFHKPPVTGADIGQKRVFYIEPGDFVLNIVFAWEGAVAVVSGEESGMIASHRFPTFRPDPHRLDVRYLLQYFRTKPGLELLGRVSPGGAGRNRTLNRAAFLQQLVPLPPLPEQRRIVAKLDEVAAKVEQARQLRDSAKDLCDHLLLARCESILRRAQASFSGQTLGTLVDQERGISYGIVLTGPPVDNGIPTLRAGDLRQFSVNPSNAKRVAPAIESSYQRTRLKGNELLLRIRGGVGDLAVCPKEMVGGNVSREIAVIPLSDRVDPRYAMFLLAAPSSQARMIRQVKGTSHVGINLKDVRNLPLPVPPMPEQHRIVAELEVLWMHEKAIRARQQQTSSELDALMPAILDQAFKGEL